MNWHVSAGGAPIGPLSEKQVITMLRAGLKIVAVAYEGGQEWSDPRAYPAFAEALSTSHAEKTAEALSIAPSPLVLQAPVVEASPVVDVPVVAAPPVVPEQVTEAPPVVHALPLVQELPVVEALPLVSSSPSSHAPASRSVKPALPSRNKLGSIGWLVGSLSLAAALAWWATARGRVAAADAGKTEPTSRTTTSPGEARASSPPLEPCNVEKLWFVSDEPTAERREKVTHEVQSWTADCRFQAMVGLCRSSCEGMLSDLLMTAAPVAERDVLARLRADTNRDITVRGRAAYKEVAELGKYALTLASSPRGASAEPGRTGGPESPAAATDLCARRMEKDFARVDELQKSIDGEKGPLPAGGFWLAQARSAIRSCLDCGDDRSQCLEIAKLLKSADDDIREHERKVEAEKKTAIR